MVGKPKYLQYCDKLTAKDYAYHGTAERMVTTVDYARHGTAHWYATMISRRKNQIHQLLGIFGQPYISIYTLVMNIAFTKTVVKTEHENNGTTSKTSRKINTSRTIREHR